MKDFVSKISLYDILAMLIPGGTIFLFLSLTLGNKLEINQSVIDPVLGWTIAIVLSYLLGIINHVCTAIVWYFFRNDPSLIISVKNNEEYIPLSIVCISIFLMILAIVGFLNLSWAILLPLILYCFVFLVVMFKAFSNDKKMKTIENGKKDIQDLYYKAYYYVAKHRYNDDIFIMEGQVAFMQNMIFPLLFFVFVPDNSPCCEYLQKICGEYRICCVKIFIAIGTILLVPSIFMRQCKIYQHVWEDYEYLKYYNNKEDKAD